MHVDCSLFIAPWPKASRLSSAGVPQSPNNGIRFRPLVSLDPDLSAGFMGVFERRYTHGSVARSWMRWTCVLTCRCVHGTVVCFRVEYLKHCCSRKFLKCLKKIVLVFVLYGFELVHALMWVRVCPQGNCSCSAIVIIKKNHVPTWVQFLLM